MLLLKASLKEKITMKLANRHTQKAPLSLEGGGGGGGLLIFRSREVRESIEGYHEL